MLRPLADGVSGVSAEVAGGAWWQIVTGLQTRADAAGLITWDVSVDSTTARAHQHALLATAELVRREHVRSDTP